MASFEYLLVTACIIGAVAACFNSGSAANISAALMSGIGDLASLVTAALAG